MDGEGKNYSFCHRACQPGVDVRGTLRRLDANFGANRPIIMRVIIC